MEKGKMKIAILSIVVAFIIFLVGWLGISVVINNFTTISSNSEVSNTTAGLSGSNTIFNIGGLLLVITGIVVTITLISYFVSSTERYKNLRKIAEFLVSTTYYFGFGLLAMAIILVPSYLLYLLYSYAVLDGHAGDILPTLQWVGIAVVAFFGIALIGYAFKKKMVDKYVKIKEEIKKEKNVKTAKVI